MSGERYNGWTNCETWLVKLWLDNDEGSHNQWTERAQECWDDASTDDGVFSRDELARIALADSLQEYHVENRPELPGIYGDLLGTAMGAVNWDEIATSFVDDADKGVTEGGAA